MIRERIRVKGAVQGVGFRPFIYRLARGLGLRGWVLNDASGVEIEVEGPESKVARFIELIPAKKPPMARIESLKHQMLKPIGYTRFEIRLSTSGEERTVQVVPDIATCGDCLSEMNTKGERRYRYPFTNCTNCGPRYTIIEKLPYDRPSTTMSKFTMCRDCRREYGFPEDRRFHAQPIACPTCGPKVTLTDAKGRKIAEEDPALIQSAKKVDEGLILAMKGLGGFLLVCDARNSATVKRLRAKKYREEKPFAVMFPTLEMIKKSCEVPPQEEALLLSPQSPIVLLKKKGKGGIAENVAPSNPFLGVMLPYAPLHHLLMDEMGFPVVATSGNKTDDPIAIDNDEALERLGGIADYFLMHDRPILRRVDDSVVRVVGKQSMMLRRARGYAPLPIPFANPRGKHVLGLGGHLKNTIGFSQGNNIFVSQHVGDLETYEALQSFNEILSSLKALYEFSPDTVAVDLHPNYISTKVGEDMCKGRPTDTPKLERVQHHHAHIASCMCDNGIDGPVLGVSWDGVGYGTDGVAWGSEFLVSTYRDYERLAHFLPFRLVGGDQATRRPSRSAIGALYQIFGDEILSDRMKKVPTVNGIGESDLVTLRDCLKSGFNSPLVCGMGRLFDAVASVIGLRQECSFEGQAAMELEFAGYEEASRSRPHAYEYEVGSGRPAVVDWRPMIRGIMTDHQSKVKNSTISLKFHQTLANIIREIADNADMNKVVLSGGVFQNALLTSLVGKAFEGSKMRVYMQRSLPPNDGGISVGQVAVALARSG
jgi:hydrogenase maturation protein HypF